jgi:hypothetical protein
VRLEGFGVEWHWASRIWSGEIGNLRGQGRTIACEWYYIENGVECQVGVRFF